jgi:hypothetical protein
MDGLAKDPGDTKRTITFPKWQQEGADKLGKSRKKALTADYSKIDVTIKCKKGDGTRASHVVHEPGSSTGTMTIFKAACDEKKNGPMKASILHELTHLAVTDGGQDRGRPVGASTVDPFNASEYAARAMEYAEGGNTNSPSIPKDGYAVEKTP